MAHNNPVIDSGIVEAPQPSDSRYPNPNPSANPAPSQASMNGHGIGGHQPAAASAVPPHLGNERANFEVGQAPPHQPGNYDQMSAAQGQASPHLPPRDQGQDPFNVTPGGVNEPHIPHTRRDDYASGGGTQQHAPINQASSTNPTSGVVNEGYISGPTSTGAGTDNRSTGAKVKESASGVKGLVAAVHGAGETLRGTFNKEVDRAFNDKAGESKNEGIAREGQAEIQEGKFGVGTKNREGAIPGADGERRKNQAF